MNRPTFLLLSLLLLTLGIFTPGIRAATPPGSPTGPALVAEIFYDEYMKVLSQNGDTQACVMKSDYASDAFKKAYQTFMKNADSDPILCAQDYPDAGFMPTEADIEGDTASLFMTSKDPAFKHSFKVFFKRNAQGVWQIDGTQDLPPAK